MRESPVISLSLKRGAVHDKRVRRARASRIYLSARVADSSKLPPEREAVERSRYEGSTVDALALEPMKDAITCEKPRRAGDTH